MSRKYLTPIVLPANPTADLEAATKQYVDSMAGTGTKMTALTTLTGANAATTDIMEVVDISDTTMAASGTNKKMTLAELTNYLGTALDSRYVNVTGDSVTGDLTLKDVDIIGTDAAGVERGRIHWYGTSPSGTTQVKGLSQVELTVGGAQKLIATATSVQVPSPMSLTGGDLTLNSGYQVVVQQDPATANHATRKSYVDGLIAALPKIQAGVFSYTTASSGAFTINFSPSFSTTTNLAINVTPQAGTTNYWFAQITAVRTNGFDGKLWRNGVAPADGTGVPLHWTATLV